MRGTPHLVTHKNEKLHKTCKIQINLNTLDLLMLIKDKTQVRNLEACESFLTFQHSSGNIAKGTHNVCSLIFGDDHTMSVYHKV